MFRSYISIALLLFTLTSVKAEDIDELVNKECTRIGSKLGSVNIQDCLDVNLTATDGRSVNNAPILIKEYPPLQRRSPLGKVLLIGGIHGDEYSSVSIVFKWMKTLDQYHSGLFHWHVTPLLNPDGLLRRKSQRINANDVDLNRNFPMDDWENTALKHWETFTGRNPRYYPGKSPLSEPESTWLVNHINEFNPDVIVAVHAPHGIVDYDGPRDAPYKLGRLHLNLLGTYPGSLGNYAGIQRKIPVVTIELPYAGIMPTNKEINDIWRDMVRWLSENITEEAYIESHSINQDAAPS
ncbi:MAG: murein peptide amidase A [Proteobacteria bacterium]|nr:murein peptide amidase A [Pseudomonadota bacterium]NOG61707.1 murein peptide amidase A [Pseudomonadota bacterium]